MIKDMFTPEEKQKMLEDKCGLMIDDMLKAIRTFCNTGVKTANVTATIAGIKYEFDMRQSEQNS